MIRRLHFITPILLLACGACAPAEDGSASTGEEEASGPQDDAADSVATPATGVLMADTGWLSVGSDGSVQTTFLDTGGRYRDLRNGVAFDAGTWEGRPDGSVCFAPEDGQAQCWAPESMGDDGTTIVTSEDGKRVEIKRITYTAPVEETDAEADAEAGARD